MKQYTTQARWDKLRKFNATAAKVGYPIVNEGGEVHFIGVCRDDTCVVFQNPNSDTVRILPVDDLRMMPVAFLSDDTPVYPGDYLYVFGDGGNSNYQIQVESACFVAQYGFTILGMVVSSNVDEFAIGDGAYVPIGWCSVDAPSPKKMVTKTGWMNVFPNRECISGTVWNTRELADASAHHTRIKCIEVHWEEEE